MSKTEEITEPLNWHFIGNLQRNKVKYVVGRAWPDPFGIFTGTGKGDPEGSGGKKNVSSSGSG